MQAMPRAKEGLYQKVTAVTFAMAGLCQKVMAVTLAMAAQWIPARLRTVPARH